MARGKNLNETVKIQPTISRQMMSHLDQFVRVGNYGSTPTAAAAYLIQRGIDDMVRDRVLVKITKRPKRR
jgi:hypothetical protein